MKAFVACGAVTLGFALACSDPDDAPDGLPDLWAARVGAPATDPCALQRHAGLGPVRVDQDDDGVVGDHWELFPEVEEVFGGDAGATPPTFFCERTGGSLWCHPRRMGFEADRVVAGWLEADAGRDRMDGVLELTVGTCLTAVDLTLTRVRWRDEAAERTPDVARCSELADAVSEPAGDPVAAHVVNPFGTGLELVVRGDGLATPEFPFAVLPWSSLRVEVPAGTVLEAREGGACVSAWRVGHSDEVVVAGEEEP